MNRIVEYKKIAVQDIAQNYGELVELEGLVMQVSSIKMPDKAFGAAEIASNGMMFVLHVYETYKRNCQGLVQSNRVLVRGQIKSLSTFAGHAKYGEVWVLYAHFVKMIDPAPAIAAPVAKPIAVAPSKVEKIPAASNKIEKTIAVSKKKSGNYPMGYTLAEWLFQRSARIPDDSILVHQYDVAGGKFRVDFMVVRRKDGKPIQAFEIDGSQHANNVMDDARTRKIKKLLGVDIHRYTNEEIFNMARGAGIKWD
jgi:very-short-patch-repair endonuclease